MKTLVRASVTALLVVAIVGLPLFPRLEPGEMQVSRVTVPLALAADGDTDGAWVSAPIEDDATVVGLTWDDPEDAPQGAEIRVQVEGEWQEWEDVEVDDEHAPDPDTPEENGDRGGTAPIIVEGADAVQFRLEGQDAPDEVVAEVIDVEDPDGRLRVEGGASEADAAPGRPTIKARSSWGGDSCVTRKAADIDYVDRVQLMFVHHTASTSSYSSSSVPGIIRGICSYHVNGRGWDDIGYNALVDRYGRVWEGRAGGIDKGVQGAHTGGFNSYSTGVAMIGNHESSGAPTSAAQDALRTYAAWKLDVHNVDPRGRVTVESKGSSKWSAGRQVTFDAMAGHRDASSTSCPGRSCYALLGEFMLRVDRTGGTKIYGGWPRDRYAVDRGASWSQTVVDLEFNEKARWTTAILDDTGRTVWKTSGTGTAATVVWDGRTSGGTRAASGNYTVQTVARGTNGTGTASPADYPLSLGRLGNFTDVPSDHRFHDEIKWLAKSKITRGCNSPSYTDFCPNDDVSRGQMAVFLAKALELPAAPHAGFRDVPRDHRFADAISRIAAAGITTGCGNGRFCPNDDVKRQQMAVFLTEGWNLTDARHRGFVDVPDGSTFDLAIRRLAKAGITVGCKGTRDRFCPGDSVTRGQMAAFIWRAEK